jgi:hypothetical protein
MIDDSRLIDSPKVPRPTKINFLNPSQIGEQITVIEKYFISIGKEPILEVTELPPNPGTFVPVKVDTQAQPVCPPKPNSPEKKEKGSDELDNIAEEVQYEADLKDYETKFKAWETARDKWIHAMKEWNSVIEFADKREEAHRKKLNDYNIQRSEMARCITMFGAFFGTQKFELVKGDIEFKAKPLLSTAIQVARRLFARMDQRGNIQTFPMHNLPKYVTPLVASVLTVHPESSERPMCHTHGSSEVNNVEPRDTELLIPLFPTY